MKKSMMVGLIALTMATSASAFSLPKADLDGDKKSN